MPLVAVDLVDSVDFLLVYRSRAKSETMSAWLLCFKATAIEVFNRRKGRRWDDAARMQLNSLSS